MLPPLCYHESKDSCADIYGPLDVSKKEIGILHIEDEQNAQGRVQCQLEIMSLPIEKSVATISPVILSDLLHSASIYECMQTAVVLHYEAISWKWVGGVTLVAKMLK